MMRAPSKSPPETKGESEESKMFTQFHLYIHLLSLRASRFAIIFYFYFQNTRKVQVVILSFFHPISKNEESGWPLLNWPVGFGKMELRRTTETKKLKMKIPAPKLKNQSWRRNTKGSCLAAGELGSRVSH